MKGKKKGILKIWS